MAAGFQLLLSFPLFVLILSLIPFFLVNYFYLPINLCLFLQSDYSFFRFLARFLHMEMTPFSLGEMGHCEVTDE